MTHRISATVTDKELIRASPLWFVDELLLWFVDDDPLEAIDELDEDDDEVVVLIL